MVALTGLEHILLKGKEESIEENPYVQKIEESGLIDKLEALQEHGNKEVYQKALRVLDLYDTETQ